MNLRDTRYWDRQFERGMPDARLSGYSREATVVKIGRLEWEKVFCVNCGGDGGLITANFSPHVFYICDLCHAKLGGLPLPEVEESLVRGHKLHEIDERLIRRQ